MLNTWVIVRDFSNSYEVEFKVLTTEPFSFHNRTSLFKQPGGLALVYLVISHYSHRHCLPRSLGSGKHLRMLSFSHPGKFMDNFDPERSTREMRKMNRRIYRENLRKNQLYDETGRLIENSKDLCDCLVVDCPGCHYPCNRCGSPKCASECRCSRKYIYEFVEVEGTILVIKWPATQEVKS